MVGVWGLAFEESGDSCHGFADFVIEWGGVAGGFRLGCGVNDAVAHVVFQKLNGEAVEGLVDGGDLGEDVDAVDVLIDHAGDTAYLPFDAAQTFEVGLFVGGVAVEVPVLVEGASWCAHIFNIYPLGVYLQGVLH